MDGPLPLSLPLCSGQLLRLALRAWVHHRSATGDNVQRSLQVHHARPSLARCQVCLFLVRHYKGNALRRWLLRPLTCMLSGTSRHARRTRQSRSGRQITMSLGSKRSSRATSDGSGTRRSAQTRRTSSQVKLARLANMSFPTWLTVCVYVSLASSDHVARLWELATGETVRQYNGHHR